MGASVSLSSESLSVVPGETTSCEVAVTNTGRLVDQFSLGLVGADGDWVTLEPASVNLMPGTTGTAAVRFAPPKSAVATAGRHEFGVRVQSREDPADSVVTEGAVEVAPYREIAAELVPGKRRARRRAKYRLAVDNLGNAETVVTIGLRDPDDELKLGADHPTITTAPGTATIVKLTAAPHRRFWRGQPKMLPFEVVATPAEGAEEVKTTGVVQQEQLMPKWLLPALAAAAVLVVAAIGAWYALLKPAVKSVATEQTQQQVARAESAASKASTEAGKASSAATVAQQAAGISPTPTEPASVAKPTTAPTPSGSTVGSKPTTAPAKTPATKAPPGKTGPAPLSFRIATQAKAVTDGSFQAFTYSAPAGKSTRISDLVLQNPRGDSGILRILIGKNVVLETGLANFRDLDYHYLQALTAAPGQPVGVSVNCTAPGAGFDRCTPSVSFSGQLA
ncbi:hypothetical protein AB0E69_04285 [Kribbella sp. NPDC026611]|uniref:COG1470 family protein n=1 Tax=Kribbella sp. NPDC026611 TaxID=3154911 RepID=UPI0033E24825